MGEKIEDIIVKKKKTWPLLSPPLPVPYLSRLLFPDEL
jgi:hypothetical protein